MGVIGILIGVELERHFLVCLFDFLEIGSRVNAQDSEGVEAVDFAIGLDGEVEPEEEDGQSQRDEEVDDEAGGAEGFEALAVLL